MFGLKRKAKMLRESFVAGATNTGNVTATVGSKLVLNWHGTSTQRDGVLQMFPVIRDKLMPGVELGSFADAIIASIHDDGMSPDNESSGGPEAHSRELTGSARASCRSYGIRANAAAIIDQRVTEKTDAGGQKRLGAFAP
jgi:hypothetical protein